MSHLTSRQAVYGLLTLWPTGLVLTLINAQVPQVTTPVFAVFAGIYVALAAAVIRCVAVSGPTAAVNWVAASIALFAIAGFTGEPTARQPSSMLINTAVLFAVSLAVLVGAVGLLVRFRRSHRMTVAVPAVFVLGIATGGFLLNLLARTAMVLTGGAEQQVTVEDTHWSAAQYLRGLSGPVDFVGYILVWLDLVQIAYVGSAYVAAGALARLATGESAVPRRFGTFVTRAAYVSAAVLAITVVAAIALPHGVDAVPAAIAFALSIPFMATLIPYFLGVAILATAANRSRTPLEAK
ncbi:hypothetical protein [Nocardia noduli]|uniref:hypothetical protein n=1 Tax=Nocardia noduli TaxID=2815722 RepID=UPI001C210459|nr:hypothetical protein [Nocardia noduli]